jgi:hypothetical protein
MRADSFIPKAVAPGVSTAINTTGGVIAIPDNSAGKRPKYVHISSTASFTCRAGLVGDTLSVATGTNAGIGVQIDSPIILDVTGCTHIIWDSSSASGSSFIQPLENGGSDE